ncbi:MAG: site-2 protease family protein [Anaerolineaceae bacterium]|nr:site-2 protease family protein [Anaerolineaceae bacterium]
MLILQFILAFAVMLFLHEFGHFIVSKAFGIEVEEFGFGLPPRICKLFTWKGTDFTLNLLPFGAFVKPKGEFDDPSENSLRSAPAWKQILVLLAGPAMNFLTAFVLFTITIHQVGAPEPSIVILDKVEQNSPAETAGMLPGDRLLQIGDTEITHYEMVSETVQKHLDQPTPIRVMRNGETLDLTVTPLSNPPEGRGAMGVVITYAVHDISLGESLKAGLQDTVAMTKSYLTGLGQIITGQVKLGVESIVGPVGMFSYFSEAAEIDEERSAAVQEHREELEKAGVSSEIRTASNSNAGWASRLSFFGLISVALGVTNLFPIPALDGGRILFLLPELLFKKKVPLKVETAFNGVCMTLLMVLMAVVMFKDIFMLSH